MFFLIFKSQSTRPADGAVVHHNVPGPQSYGVPLLDLEPGDRHQVGKEGEDARTKSRRKDSLRPLLVLADHSRSAGLLAVAVHLHPGLELWVLKMFQVSVNAEFSLAL